MNKLIRIGVLSLLPALTFAASHDLKTFITEYDLDKDGSVSKEEFVKERERRYSVTDANHDGGLSHDEYVNEFKSRLEAGHPDASKTEKAMKQADVRFNVLDSNKDGRISPAEFQHSGWNMFTHHDYTKDGAISAKDDVESPSRSADAKQKAGAT